MRRFKKSSVLLLAVIVLLVLPLASIKGDNGVTTDARIAVDSYSLIIQQQEPSGKPETLQVVNWLALDGDGTVTVEKPSGFVNDPKIQPMNGFSTPEVKDGQLTWKDVEVDGNRNVISISTADEESRDAALEDVPLELKYSYWLDGEKVEDLADIAGKSGRFRLECYMKNTSKEKRLVTYEDSITGEEKTEKVEVYLPIVISPTNWYFDNTVFSNLKADPTSLVVYLPNYYQTGWSIPLFPPATAEDNTIWVEADVKDFKMDPLTMAVAFHFPKTNQRDTIPEFKAGLSTLYGGVVQLGAGLAEAVVGLGSTGAANTLIYGANAIAGGLALLGGDEGLGAAEAALGDKLIPGVDQLLNGIGSTTTPNTLLYATGAVTDGLGQLQAGIGSATTPDSLLFGMTAITGGLNQFVSGIGSATTPNSLLYGANAITGGLAGIQAGIGSPTTPDTLLYAANAVSGGLGQIKAGIGTAGTPDTLLYATSAVTGGLEQTKAGIGDAGTEGTLLYGTNQINAGLNTMKAGIGSTITPDTLLYAITAMTGGLNGIVTGIGNASTPGTLLYADNAVLGGVNQIKAGFVNNLSSLPLLIGALQQMELATDSAVVGGMYDYVNRVLTGLSAGGGMYDYIQTKISDPDLTALNDYMTTYRGYLNGALGGISSMNLTLNALIPQVQQSLVDVQTALVGIGTVTTPDTLLYAIDQMRIGLEGMKTGIGSAGTAGTLLYAANAITGGLNQFATGIGSSTAEGTLLYGINAVTGGLQQTKAGIGSAGTPGTMLFGTNAIAGGLTSISTNIGAVSTPGTLLFGMSAISGGLNTVNAGIGSATTPDTLLYGTHALTGGLAQLLMGIGSATTPDTLLYGANAVTGGLNTASAAIGSVTTPDTLLYGMNALYGGLSQVAGSVSTGSAANPGLLEGLVQLKAGTAKAVAGIGTPGTDGTLLYGATQIEGGLGQLQEGLTKAVTEGTNVMEEGLAESIAELDLTQGELVAIAQAGKEFDAFLGKVESPKGAENNLRMITQTKPVQTPVTNSMWIWMLVIGLAAAVGIVLIGSFAFRRLSA